MDKKTVGDEGRRVRVAVIQRGPAGDDPKINLEENLSLIDDAAKGRPDFIVLNELSTTPYFCVDRDARYFRWAEPIPGPATARVGERARRHGCSILFPLYEELPPDGLRFNSVAVIGPDGGLIPGKMPDGTRVHRFAKVHLAQTPKTGVDETFFFRGGPGFPVFSTPKARIGVLVCYDRRFPEGWRALALQGAEVVFMVADVPAWAPSSDATAEEMFLVELRTRALENLFFVVASNKVGVETVGDKKTRFFGRSCVLSPTGAVLAEASPKEPTIFHASIDLEEVTRARTTLPYFTGRKPDAYEILTRPLL